MYKRAETSSTGAMPSDLAQELSGQEITVAQALEAGIRNMVDFHGVEGVAGLDQCRIAWKREVRLFLREEAEVTTKGRIVEILEEELPLDETKAYLVMSARHKFPESSAERLAMKTKATPEEAEVFAYAYPRVRIFIKRALLVAAGVEEDRLENILEISEAKRRRIEAEEAAAAEEEES